MTTAFQTGPGFFAADTPANNPRVPAGHMRVFCARIEAYDIPCSNKVALDTTFTVLFAMAEDNPESAKAMIKLGQGIAANKELLEQFATK